VLPGNDLDAGSVVVQSIATGQRKVLVERAVDGRYTTSGHLIYGVGGALHAQRFDPARLEVSGAAAPVLADVFQQTSAGAWGGYDYDVSDDGTLIYVPRAAAALRRVLIWVDRAGRLEELPTEPRAYQYPRLSPDHQRVALDLRDQQNDVWVWDLARAGLTPVTIGRRAGGPAIWTRDGQSVLFGPNIAGIINIHQQPLSGGTPRRLTTSRNTQFVDVTTPDGASLVFNEQDSKSGFDLFLLPLDGAASPQELIRTPFNEYNADLSPDGKWIAYQSDESGRFEVYVRPFPRVADGRWPVSVNGGTRPLWGRDGRELFYLDQSRRMTVVSVVSAPTLSFGQPQTLFETAQLGLEGQQRNFELGPDGKRFLMVKNLPPPPDVPPLVLVQNWFEELRAKVP
jgi:serine/threonine-protein kinase